MDSHDPAWREVETWVRNHMVTLEGHELATWPNMTELQRNEAYLKSVFIQWARSRPEEPDRPVSVQMTYDPVSSPDRPVYGPIFDDPDP